MSDAMSEATLHTPARSADRAALLWLSLRQQWIFFVIPLLYVATTTWFLRDVPEAKVASVRALVMGMITLTIPAGLVAVFLFRLGQYVFVLKPASPSRQMIADVAGLFRKPAALIVGLPLLAAMVVFNKGMLELKPMIPYVIRSRGTRRWRTSIAACMAASTRGCCCSRCLATTSSPSSSACSTIAGSLPSSLLHVVRLRHAHLGEPHPVLPCLHADLVDRRRTAGGGVLLGRPGLLRRHRPFARSLCAADGLSHDVNTRMAILSLDTQQLLWDGYTGKTAPIGISAFPSMHNASALLFALATARRSRALGIAFGIYCGIILVGSVHLGWHYAVDGMPESRWRPCAGGSPALPPAGTTPAPRPGSWTKVWPRFRRKAC